MRLTGVLLLIGVLSCGGEPESGRQKGSFFAGRAEGIRVQVVTVSSREISEPLTAKGKTAVSDRFEAKAPSAVRVDRIFVEEGQQVSAGDPLIKFEDQESQLRLNKARADQKEAEAGLAEVNYLQTNRDRLIEEGKLSEVESEGLDEKVNLYQATLDRARAEIELLERALENTQINSPIAGTVTKRNVSEGSSVDEGDPMMEILRISPIHFVFSVPVQVAATLEKSGEVEVKFPALGGQSFAGQVLTVGGEVVAGNHGVEVKLSLPNEVAVLKGEMDGEIDLPGGIKKKVFPVPASAIQRTDRSAYLFRIDGNRAKKIPAEVGPDLNGQPTVVKGVKEGDLVVVSANKKLNDGETVEIEKTK